MGLDEFMSEGSTGSSDGEDKESNSKSDREYVEISKEEFEEFMDNLPWVYSIKDYDWTNEWVYEIYSNQETKCIRIYSSIDKRDDKGRHVGSDAIKTVLLQKVGKDDNGEPIWRPLRKEKSTYRIKTWRKNLRKKIDNIVDSKDDLKWCDECGRLMIVQTNKENQNKFWGCTGYYDEDNQCTNTEPIG